MSAPVQTWDDILIEGDTGDTLHIVPVDDWVGHELADDCVCGPHVEPLGVADMLVAHYALDKRPE